LFLNVISLPFRGLRWPCPVHTFRKVAEGFPLMQMVHFPSLFFLPLQCATMQPFFPTHWFLNLRCSPSCDTPWMSSPLPYTLAFAPAYPPSSPPPKPIITSSFPRRGPWCSIKEFFPPGFSLVGLRLGVIVTYPSSPQKPCGRLGCQSSDVHPRGLYLGIFRSSKGLVISRRGGTKFPLPRFQGNV